ncbi:hypothetical protein KDA00_03565 [Candidatus Saccharibacteria bacterium]|nr:hypothetical protein [Candidatus Saccharibacteria bacterium]
MTYSNSLSVSRQKFAGKNQNTTRYQVNEKTIGPVTNTIVLIVLTCLLGLLYLTQVTKTNSYSYKLDDLRKQQTELSSQQSQLEVEAARLQSLERVKNSSTTKNLVSVAPSATVQN